MKSNFFIRLKKADFNVFHSLKSFECGRIRERLIIGRENATLNTLIV